MKKLTPLVLILLFTTTACINTASQGDPYAPAFDAFGIILIATLIGRFIARKLNVSLVLGEIIIGIMIGAF